ncbi:hypothetical protein ACWGKS_00195 [Nocardiopsis sp. NPDC055879]
MSTALLSVLLLGCSAVEDSTEPEPMAEAEVSDFEELSGAEIPESAESVEVFAVGDVDSWATYVATFTLPDEEEAGAFCRSGDIGNHRIVSAGDLEDKDRQRHFIGDTELVDPRRCTSVKQGENVDRSAVFSFPEGKRVLVWAVTEEIGW